MKLIRQRPTWHRGERTLTPDPTAGVSLPLKDVTTSDFIRDIVTAMNDIRVHTGVPPSRLELTLDEWTRIRWSKPWLDTVRYVGTGAIWEAARPESLSALLGIEIYVDGYTSPLPPMTQPPPKEMNCRNCGAPPKLNRYDCAHCGTRYDQSQTPTRPSVKASGLTVAELAETMKDLAGTGYATLPVGAVMEFVKMPLPRVPLDNLSK